MHFVFPGYLDIREGISSEGESILSLESEGELAHEAAVKRINQPPEGFTSSKGLYIDLTILNEGPGEVEFVYGFMHNKKGLLNTSKRLNFIPVLRF